MPCLPSRRANRHRPGWRGPAWLVWLAAALLWCQPALAQSDADLQQQATTLLAVVAIAGIVLLIVVIVAASRNITNHATKTFRSPTGPGALTVGLLVLTAVAKAVLIVALYGQIAILAAVQAGEDVDFADADASDMFVVWASSLTLLLTIATGAAMMCWLSRARANLPALGVDNARWGPGWAVGWWFVPIMSFFRPYQLTAEVYRASAGQPERWQMQPATVVGWWWFFWLASSIGGGIAAGFYRTGEFALQQRDISSFLSRMLTGSWLDLIAAIFAIGGVLPLVVLIRRINANQDARMQAMPAPPAQSTAMPGSSIIPASDAAPD